MGTRGDLMKKLFLHPVFHIGFLIRVLMVIIILPKATTEWYVPFLDTTTSQFTLDPWKFYLDQGGLFTAFPYGYMMWLIFLPFTVISKLAGLPIYIGYGFTLILADLGLLIVLYKLLPGRERLLLGAYWLSPIILLATYWLGFNDLIPVLLLSLALYFTQKLRLVFAGILSIAAVSAKLSMVLAIPIFFIYLIRNRALRQLFPDYLKGITLAGLVLCLPFAFSSSGIYMLFSNPEMDKIYQLVLFLGAHTQLYILPMLYIVVLYLTWRLRRLNFNLFISVLGMTFLLVVLLTPASPGWFIWILPFLIMYQAMSGGVATALVWIFSVLYVLDSLIVMPAPSFAFGNQLLLPTITLPEQIMTRVPSLLLTMMAAIGIILALRIWRESVSSNDYFRLSRKPFVIGISGDLGAGKDTLSNSLKGLFGSHSVTLLSGDDYHLWDQHKPMWQVMTRLNPKANNLETFANHLVALIDGKHVHSRRYDYRTGKMGRPFLLKGNDFIIVNGLHALFLPSIRTCYDLSIYLDTDERLRHYFMQRHHANQYSSDPEHIKLTIEKQLPDSIRFIHPQAKHADLVMSLQPIHPHTLFDPIRKEPVRIKLSIRSRSGLNELSLTRVLVGVCGLHVDTTTDNEINETIMSIEGETSAEDIAMAAKMLVPRIMEFLDISPQWADGVLGLMQLIVLTHINQALNKRLLW